MDTASWGRAIIVVITRVAKPALSSLLVFLFVLAPLAPLFADEDGTVAIPDAPAPATPDVEESVDIDTTLLETLLAPDLSDAELQTADDSVAPSDEVVPEDAITPEDPKADEPIDEDEPPISMLSSSDIVESFDNSRLNHSNTPKLNPDESMGSFRYSFPIVVPPGRGGLAPDLQLTYDQNSGKNEYLGLNWSTNIPYIERINRTGSENLYTATYFTSSFDGELKATSTGAIEYGALVENGQFRKYEFVGNDYWKMTDKTGVVYKFGLSTTTRQMKNDVSTTTFRWMLEEVRDLADNYISYTYYKDSGQIYPNKITYTGSGATPGIYEVEFIRAYNPDIATTTAAGFPVKTYYKISEVQVKISGSWTRKYSLTYSNGFKNINKLLSTITEYGKDDAGATTTIPAYTFTYNAGFNPVWTLDTSYATNSLEYFVVVDGGLNVDTGRRPIDANSDGYGDIVFGRGANRGVYVNTTQKDWNYIPSGSGWDVPDEFVTAEYIDNGIRIFDANGDAKPDLIRAYDSVSTSTYLQSGTGWYGNNFYRIPASFPEGVRFGDVNGDGLTDIIQAYGNGTTSRKVYIHQGDGTGWVEDSNYVVPIVFQTTRTDNNGGDVADVNRDGLADLIIAVSTSTSQMKVFINKGDGTGWTHDVNYVVPTEIVKNGETQGVRIVDVTNDGYPDFVLSDTDTNDPSGIRKVYVNNGNGTGWSDYGSVTIPGDFQYYGKDMGYRFMDINGDGIQDLLEGYLSGGATRRNVYINSGNFSDTINYPDSLTSITSPLGGKVEVKYLTTPLYKSSGSIDNPRLPLTINTVRYIVRNDGFGNLATTTYSYGNGSYYFLDPRTRKFAGFATTTVTDPTGNVTTMYFHQGNDSQSAIGEYSDSFAKIGKPYRIEINSGASTLYKKTINKWDQTSLGNGRNFVRLVQTVTSAFDGLATHRDVGSTYAYDDTTGNVTENVEYGEVIGSDDGTFSDIGSDKRTTTHTYAASTTLHLIGLPSRELLVDNASTTVKDTKHYYDSLAAGSVSKGNETKTEFWISGTTYASTSKAFNGYGLVATSTDARGNSTGYTYDTHNLFISTSTNALSQVTGYLYDYSLGKPKQVTDPNGLVFQTVYDGVDRVVQEKVPDQTTPATLVLKTQYTYTDTALATAIQKRNYLSGSITNDIYQYFDGLGRTLQTRSQADGVNTYAVKDRAYDSLGLLQKETVPYFSSSTARTTATTSSAVYTTYAYDALGRATTTANSVGTTTNSYVNWRTITTDARGKSKDLYKDAFGNLDNVVERLEGVPATTTYTWTAKGNLTKITDALGNVRNFTFDGLGRRISAEDLHAPGDTLFGTSTYAYDDAGNMTQLVDARNQTTNYTYDALNRLLTEDYTGVAGTDITNTYDSCTHGVGRLCSASTTAVQTTYTYSPHGQVASEGDTISGTAYTTSFVYDRQGNQATTTYPDGALVQYFYNSGNLVESIQKKESGGAYVDVVSNIDYAPNGQPTVIAYANGALTTNTYNQNALHRLTSKVTTLANNFRAQDLAYTYDAGGNITQIVDTSYAGTPKTIAYTYDDLNRMLTASTTGATSTPNYKQTYSYNVLGNILSGPLGTYSYTGDSGGSYANPHALTAIATSSGSGGMSTSTIGFDATSTSITTGYNGGPTTKTWTHTVTGTSPIIVLTADIWQDVGGTGSISSASWNGGALTKATSTRRLGMASEIWYLVATTTGAKTMSVTVTGATDAIKMAAASFTGVSATDPLDFVVTSTGSTGNPKITATSTTNAEVIVSTLSRFSTTDATTSQTALYKDRVTSTLGAASYTFATSASAFTDTYTGSANQDWSMAAAVFKAATTSGASYATTTLTHDQSGNLTSDGTFAFTWDWRNRMSESATGTATSTYIYDQQDGRSKTVEGALTTFFPNKLYNNTTGSATTTTKHIFANGMEIAAIESSASVAATTTTHSVYAEAITSGWNDWSWSTTLDYANTSPVRSGTYSLKTTHAAAWAGMYLNNAGISTATSTHLSFSVRTTDAAPYIQIEAYGPSDALLASVGLNTYIPGGSMSANTWYDVSIPLVDLSAASTTLTGIVGMRSTSGSVYWDDLKLVATSSSAGTTTTRYLHTDHLGGTQFVSDATGAVIEAIDYYPYGEARLDTKVGSYGGEKRKYIGEEFDQSTNLSYLNARYYSGTRGSFLSEDPIFLGDPGKQNLQDPQTLNSYAYGNGNPIGNKDPSGKCAALTPVCLAIIGAALNIGGAYAGEVLQNSAAGSTNPYEFNLSLREVTSSGAIGAVSLGVIPEGRAAAGLYAFGSSLYEDYLNDNPYDFERASIEGGTALVTGTLFKGLVGKVPARLETQALIGNATFQTASSVVASNYSAINTSQQIARIQSSSSLTSSQAASFLKTANSFGFTSPTQAQIKAVQAVKASFSK